MTKDPPLPAFPLLLITSAQEELNAFAHINCILCVLMIGFVIIFSVAVVDNLEEIEAFFLGAVSFLNARLVPIWN